MESLEIDQTCTKGSEPEKGSTVVHDEDVDEQNPKGTELEETTTISQPKEGGDQHDHEEDCVKETTDSVLCSKGNDVEGASMVVGEGDGIPHVGMKFDSEHEAYNFYNAYATRIGFSVRRAKVRYTANSALWQCYYFCSNQGLKVEMRTDCKARICFEVTDGVSEVTHFNPDQNHTLADSEQRKFLRSYGKVLQKRSSTSKSSLDSENPEEDEDDDHYLYPRWAREPTNCFRPFYFTVSHATDPHFLSFVPSNYERWHGFNLSVAFWCSGACSNLGSWAFGNSNILPVGMLQGNVQMPHANQDNSKRRSTRRLRPIYPKNSDHTVGQMSERLEEGYSEVTFYC